MVIAVARTHFTAAKILSQRADFCCSQQRSPRAPWRCRPPGCPEEVVFGDHFVGLLTHTASSSTPASCVDGLHAPLVRPRGSPCRRLDGASPDRREARRRELARAPVVTGDLRGAGDRRAQDAGDIGDRQQLRVQALPRAAAAVAEPPIAPGPGPRARDQGRDDARKHETYSRDSEHAPPDIHGVAPAIDMILSISP